MKIRVGQLANPQKRIFLIEFLRLGLIIGDCQNKKTTVLVVFFIWFIFAVRMYMLHPSGIDEIQVAHSS